jgi:hypothetical protein
LDPLINIDTDGVITDVNEAIVKATDKKRKKLIATHFIAYFVEPEKVQEVYKEIFKKSHVMNYPLTIILIERYFAPLRMTKVCS